MSSVHFRSVSKAYRGRRALDAVTFDVEPQGFVVLCGPPKSGKSVLFRLLVGLEAPDDGRILIGNEDITAVPAARRRIGYVPQSFALYPHLTVYDNIAYPLKLAGVARSEIASRVDRAAGMLSIAHLLKKTPDQLSGGEKQRTAVARGLLKNADVFVLDDPLVGLDYKLRERLMDDLKSLREELGATFVYGTSDSLEALTMAKRLAVMDAGRLVQYGPTEDVYGEPDHVRAFELVGFPRANILAGSLSNGVAAAGPFRFRTDARSDGEDVLVGFRPEAVRLDGEAAPDATARVHLVEDLGGEFVVYLDADGHMLTAGFPVGDRAPPPLNAQVPVFIDPGAVHVFAATSGHRLGRGST